MCFCARSLLFQKSGAPIWASIASISRCFCSQSKKPPQVAGALLDVLDVVESFGSDHNERTMGAKSGRRGKVILSLSSPCYHQAPQWISDRAVIPCPTR
jgi:hypothetical protein